VKSPVKRQKLEDGSTEAPTKVCPQCYGINHAAAKSCEVCDYEFTDEYAIELTETASDKEILYTPPEPEWGKVSHVTYERYQKEGKSPCVLAKYFCGLSQVWIWYFFEFSHGDTALWWKQAAPDIQRPTNTDDALKLLQSGAINKPSRILVVKEGKYERIKQYDFTQAS